MRVIVLVLTMFFHGPQPPETRAMIVPAGVRCLEVGPAVKQRLLAANPKARDVAWACVVMKAQADA